MDKELKAKWVDALRSGKYAQAEGVLRSADVTPGFCCLGVLLEVSQRGHWDCESYLIEGDCDGEIILIGELDSYARNVGLTTDEECKLIQMNDGKEEWQGNRQTFEQIAAFIESAL